MKVGNSAVWNIEHYVSNTSIITVATTIYFSILFLTFAEEFEDEDLPIWADIFFSDGATGFHSLSIIFLFSQVLGYIYFIMKNSVGAIRYLDPSWDKLNDGELLWPSIFYIFGVKNYID